MIPDPFDLLCDLIKKPFPDFIISWASHILLSNPMENQERFRWFKDLLDSGSSVNPGFLAKGTDVKR